eukprot:scaffold7349_cov145-Skeletonema_menzelii.AAC.16
MDPEEFLIIRNSTTATNYTDPNNNKNFIADDGRSSIPDNDSEPKSLHVNRDASLSIVRLIESSEGQYMLDFGLENDPIITSFLDNHIEDNSGDSKIFIEDTSLKHLEVYAELAGVGSSIKGELEVQPSSEVLQHHFENYKHSLYLLPDSVRTVLYTLLPLEKLFSWSTLTSARDEGLLRWKDIRKILSEVKRYVPFAPTSDGLFRHIIQTHLTFHQFSSFAKLVEGSLQKLPEVKVKVYQSSTLSIDVQLTSDQNCTLCIGCLPNAQLSTPPSTQQLQECTEDIFVSWERVQLIAEEGEIVRLEGLKEGTVYDMYIYVSRPSSEFPVESTHADVVNSRSTVETQGCHLIDIFPVFDSMTKEEQKVELLASTQDKSVRLKAQADGLVIPGIDEEQNDYDNETWRLYIEWWKDRLGIRYDFCMRELLFASNNQEVRSFARKEGIIMSHGISKDRTKRERWARAFGSWYHNHEQEPTTGADSQIQISTEAAQQQANPPVQTLNLPGSEVDEIKVGSLRPIFHSRTSKAEVKIEEEYNDSLGDALVLQSITLPQSKVVSPSTTTHKDFTKRCSTRNESTHVPGVSSELASPESTSDSFHMSPCGHDETKVPPHAQVSDTLGEELSITPKPTPSESSRLTIGVVGKVVGSFRHRFLRRLSTRIDTCLALTRPKTPSSLRGIALFRAKVRLVMLLQKVSNKPFSTLNDVDIFSYQQRDTRSAKSSPSTLMNEEEEDDDDDSVLMKKARDHCEDRLARNVFRTIRTWAQEAAAEKRAEEEKTLAAVEAFQSLLLRKCFRSFVEAVKSAKESAEEDTIEEDEVPPEPPKNEVEYMRVEGDDSCEFASHQNTGRDALLCRNNLSSDVGVLIHVNRSRIKFLDDETLSSMRRAKRAGASNLYDVPASFLRFNDPAAAERAMHCFRNRDIVRGILPFA